MGEIPRVFFIYIGKKNHEMSRIVRKPDFCLGENKVADQLISAFVFATRIVQFLFFLNPKFQASSSFLSLYRPVCVGPGRKPRRPVFSRRGSNEKIAGCGLWDNEQSPQGGAFSRDLLDQRSKYPLYPGGGALVTNDECILESYFAVFC